jgi:hypothetical protein
MLYVALDDAAEIHERIGTTVADAVAKGAAKGGWLEGVAEWIESYPSYVWQVAVGPLFLAAGVFMLLFLWRELVRPGQRGLFLAALGCFALAMMLDFTEGIDSLFERARQAVPTWSDYTLTHPPRVLEECLEMIGTAMLGWVFVAQLGLLCDPVKIVFHAPERPSSNKRPYA